MIGRYQKIVGLGLAGELDLTYDDPPRPKAKTTNSQVGVARWQVACE